MLLSLSFQDSLLFIIPFVATAAVTVALFRSASQTDSTYTVLKVVLGVLFLFITLGIGACFGTMWNFHLDVT